MPIDKQLQKRIELAKQMDYAKDIKKNSENINIVDVNGKSTNEDVKSEAANIKVDFTKGIPGEVKKDKVKPMSPVEFREGKTKEKFDVLEKLGFGDTKSGGDPEKNLKKAVELKQMEMAIKMDQQMISAEEQKKYAPAEDSFTEKTLFASMEEDKWKQYKDAKQIIANYKDLTYSSKVDKDLDKVSQDIDKVFGGLPKAEYTSVRKFNDDGTENFIPTEDFKVKGGAPFLEESKQLAKLAATILGSGASFVSGGLNYAQQQLGLDKDSEIFTEKMQEEYEQAKLIVDQNDISVLAEEKAKVDRKIAQVSVMYKDNAKERDAILKSLEHTRDVHQNNIDYKNSDQGFLQDLKQIYVGATSLTGVNVINLVDSWEIDNIVEKIGEGETLSKYEEDRFDAYVENEAAIAESLQDNNQQMWGNSASNSGQIVLEMAAADFVLKGMGKGVAKALRVGGKGAQAVGLQKLKQIADIRAKNAVSFTDNNLAKILFSATAMPTTTQGYFDNKLSKVQKITDLDGNNVYVAGDKRKLALVDNVSSKLEIINSDIAIAKEKGLKNLTPEEFATYNENLEKRDAGNSVLSQLVVDGADMDKLSAEDLVLPEEGKLHMFKKSFSESVNFRVAEMAGGVIGAAGSKFTKGLSKTRLGQSKVGQAVSAVNRKGTQAVDWADYQLFKGNKVGRITQQGYRSMTGGGKMIHGTFGEFGEEMLEQIMPVYGQTIEEYAEGLKELGSPDFYANVAASTFLMRGAFGSAGTLGKGAIWLRNKDNYREKSKQFSRDVYNAEAVYREMDKAVTNDDVARTILMHTPGTIFSELEYEVETRKILAGTDEKYGPLNLSPEERREKAQQFQESSFKSRALNAFKTNTASTFRNSLDRLANSNSEQIDQSTKDNARKAIEKLDMYEEILKKHQGKINIGDIINLEIRKDLVKEGKNEVQKELDKLVSEGTVQSQFEKYRKERGESSGLDSFTLEEIKEEIIKDANRKEGEEMDTGFSLFLADLKEFSDSKFGEQSDLSQYILGNVDLARIDLAENKIQEDLDYQLNEDNIEAIKTKQKEDFKKAIIEKVKSGEVDAKTAKTHLKKVKMLTPEIEKELNKKEVDNTNLDANQKNPTTVKITKSEKARIKAKKEADKITKEVEGTQEFQEFVDGLGDITAANEAYKAQQKEETGGVTTPIKNTVDTLNTENTSDIIEEDGDQYAMKKSNPDLNPTEAHILEVMPGNIAKLKKLSPAMTLESFISSVADNVGYPFVQEYFHALGKAFEIATGMPMGEKQIEDSYNRLFTNSEGDRIIRNALNPITNELPANTPVSTQEVTEVAEKVETGTAVKETKVYDPVTEMDSDNIKPVEGYEKRFHGVSDKLGGVLGINYVRDPETGKYTNVDNNDVNPEAFPFLDYRNFIPGDRVDFVFNMDYLLDPNKPMTYWTNTSKELPNKKTTTTRGRLVGDTDTKGIFENVEGIGLENGKPVSKDKAWENVENLIKEYQADASADNLLFTAKDPGGINVGEEFLKIVPTGIRNTDGKLDSDGPEILEGGFNDYYWFNNGNVTLLQTKDGQRLLSEREERIAKNKALNLSRRQAMLANNGETSLVVSERKDPINNFHPDAGEVYHSIMSNFNTLEEALENVGVGVVASKQGKTSLVHFQGKTRDFHITVGDHTITNPETEISNWTSLKGEVLKNQNKKSFDGSVIMVVKTGIDAKGNPIFSAHNVITNHPQQDKTKQTVNRDKFNLITASIIPRWRENNQQANIDKVSKWFEDNMGIKDLSKVDMDILGQAFPGKNPAGETIKDEKGKVISEPYVADFSMKSAGGVMGAHARAFIGEGRFQQIPNLKAYGTIDNFIEAILAGDEIEMIDTREQLLSDLHTPIKFTRIENDGKAIYSIDSQPRVNFSEDGSVSTTEVIIEKVEEVNKEEVDRLTRKNSVLQKELDKALSEGNTKQQETLSAEIRKNEKRISDLGGQTVDTDTQSTPGTSQITEVSNKNVAINTLTAEITGRAINSIDLSVSPTVETIMSQTEAAFNKLEKDLREAGKTIEADFLVENKSIILGLDGNYDGSVKEYISIVLDNKELTETLSDLEQTSKDYNKDSSEIDVTRKVSDIVKILFANIKDTTAEVGFGGLRGNITAHNALDALHQMMTFTDNNSLQEIERVATGLVQTSEKNFKFLNEIVKRLKKLEEENPKILNELLYSIYQPKMQMKFVMFGSNENGKASLNVYDANVNDPIFRKKYDWKENLKMNSLIEPYNRDFYRINQDGADRAKSLYKNISEGFLASGVNGVKRQDLVDYLTMFGIELNSLTVDRVFGEVSDETLGDASAGFDLVQRLLGGVNSITGQLNSNLDEAISKVEKGEELTLRRNAPNGNFLDLLERKNTQIYDLIKLDNSVEFHFKGSMRIAGKNINHYKNASNIETSMQNLKSAIKEYIQSGDQKTLTGKLLDMSETPIQEDSLFLQMVLENPKQALQSLDVTFTSLEAIKDRSEKSRDDRGVTELSAEDKLTYQIGMFLHNDGKFEKNELESESSFDPGITLRKGIQPFPTVSDSHQLPLMSTVFINIDGSHVVDGEISSNIMSIIKQKLIESELKRVADFLSKAQDNTTIKDYEDGARLITTLPFLNTLAINPKDVEGNPIQKNGKDITRTFMQVFEANLNNYTPKEFIELYAEQVEAGINEYFADKVQELVSDDLSSGKLIDAGLVDTDGNINVQGQDHANRPAKEVAYDYMINYHLQMKEIINFFAGDMAQYFKGKSFRDVTHPTEKGEVISSMQHGIPKVTFDDIVDYYYPENKAEIEEFIGNKKLKNLSKEEMAELTSNFPNLAFAEELLNDTDVELGFEKLLPIAELKLMEIFKDADNNMAKRLKGQVSPGKKYINAKNLPNYLQIMIEDVEDASLTIKNLIGINPEYKHLLDDSKFMEKLNEFMELDKAYILNKDDSTRHKNLRKEIGKSIPNIAAYLETASTDAQEYTSWGEHLDLLKTQGRISEVDAKKLSDKIERQEKDIEKQGYISQENLFNEQEREAGVMQPVKPLYSGIDYVEMNGHKIPKYTYIKSSSFPLTPELTQMFPSLNNLRKKIKDIESHTGKRVRASYQSANKIGGLKNAINISDLYRDKNSFDGDADRYQNHIESIVSDYSVELSRDNFYIQQDTPFHSDKNAKEGKQDRRVRATQFEKIILGDGISEMGSVFPSASFSSSLLEGIEIDTNGNIDGPALKKIATELYKREQEIFTQELFSKLGIESYSDIADGKISAMENIARIFNNSLDNKQDKESLELIYLVHTPVGEGRVKEEYITKQELSNRDIKPLKAMFRIPSHMTPNSNKMESVLNSTINKNSINLSVPGFIGILGSSEGFSMREYDPALYADAAKRGLVVSENFDPAIGLQSERIEDGVLKPAQIFVANKFKILNPETQQYEYLDLTEYVLEGTNIIDTSKLPAEITSLFSFRIPTSSHQSGSLVEIVGFLPHTSGDLVIAPKDHTIQIGEDFDIDERNFYMYNIVKNENGTVSKLDYTDLTGEKDIQEFRSMFEEAKQNLWDNYLEKTDEDGITFKNEYLKSNKDVIAEIALLQKALDNRTIKEDLGDIYRDKYEVEVLTDTFVKTKIEELERELVSEDFINKTTGDVRAEYRLLRDGLIKSFKEMDSELAKSWENYKNSYDYNKKEKAIIENNIVSLYKSVFGSASPEVRGLVTKVLSTDFPGDTADMIQDKKSSKNKFYSMISPEVQDQTMKAGADGKLGIGVHSNMVTMNSTLQQLGQKVSVFKKIIVDGKPVNIPYEIRLRDMTFDGSLGQTFDKQNKRRISESLMESQNSATDNQKLQIMAKRNENKHTIGVLALLQMSGLDIGQIGDQEVSYGSLFISQPIIQEYVSIIEGLDGSTNKFKGDAKAEAVKILAEKYADRISDKYKEADNSGKTKLNSKAREELGLNLSVDKLYEQINSDNEITDIDSQYYVLESFLELTGANSQVTELQRFMNIENGGMGKSFFDVIELKDKLIGLNKINIGADTENNILDKIIGKLETISTDDVEGKKDLVNQGYVFISDENGISYYIEPTTQMGHKIVNSISMGYNSWKTIFPYDDGIVKMILDDAVESSGVNPNSQIATEIKYAVISSMKEYTFADSKSLFNGNVDQARRELFIDTDTNESLGLYIARLRKAKSEIMDLPFFKDLNIEFNKKDYPTTIEYNTGDMSPENNTRIYNNLKNLATSNKELPITRNGKRVTEAQFIQDLFKFSLLAEQGGGATGFRKLMPIDLFTNNSVDALLRSRNNNENFRQMSSFYNGPKNTVEKLLGDKIDFEGKIRNNNGASPTQINSVIALLNRKYNQQGQDNLFVYDAVEDTVTIKVETDQINTSTFIEQFFQHNPAMVKDKVNYASTDIRTMIKDNGFTDLQIARNEINSFASKIFKNNFMTIQSSEGQPMLYKKVDELNDTAYYERIPTLGVHGLNEYDPGKSNITESLVFSNNFDKSESVRTTSPLSSTALAMPNRDKLDMVTLVKETLMNTDSSRYSGLLEAIRPFLNEMNFAGVKVETGTFKGNAMYKASTNTIYFNDAFLNVASTKQIQDAVVEEMLHFVTSNALNPYLRILGIKDNGELEFEQVADSIPAEVQGMVTIYNYALKHYRNKYGEKVFNDKLAEWNAKKAPNSGELLQPSTDHTAFEDAAYAASDIHEFIAAIFIKDTDFSKEMGETEYRKSGKTILARFSDMLERLFRRILPDAKKSSISTHLASELFDFLNREQKEGKLPKIASTGPNLQATQKFDTALQILKDLQGEQEYQIENSISEDTSRTSQVQDLSGNTYSVNESDITTYETEFGSIRYITDENGDMVMLSDTNIDSEQDQKDFTIKNEFGEEYFRNIYTNSKYSNRQEILDSDILGLSVGKFTPDENNLYHGTSNFEIDQDGNLIMKPSKNFSGKTSSISMTQVPAVALDYMIRKGGDTIIKVKNEFFGENYSIENAEEVAINTTDNLIVPEGMYEILPVDNQYKEKDSSGKIIFDYLEERVSNMKDLDIETLLAINENNSSEQEVIENEMGWEAGDSDGSFANEVIINEFGGQAQTTSDGAIAKFLISLKIDKDFGGDVNKLVKYLESLEGDASGRIMSNAYSSGFTPYSSMVNTYDFTKEIIEDRIKRFKRFGFSETLSELDYQDESMSPSGQEINLSKDRFNIPLENNYRINTFMTYSDGTKKPLSIYGNDIEINPFGSKQEMVNYLKGDDSKVGQMRKKTFKYLESLGFDSDYINSTIQDTKQANDLMVFIARDHIANNDANKNWKGDLELGGTELSKVNARAIINGLMEIKNTSKQISQKDFELLPELREAVAERLNEKNEGSDVVTKEVSNLVEDFLNVPFEYKMEEFIKEQKC